MNGLQFNQFQPQISPYSYPRYTQPSNGITWVQGIEGAKAYQLAPNSNVLLMDSDNDNIFYIKVSDSVGMCNLRTFNYTEITNQPTTKTGVDMSNYVTKSELKEILNKLQGVKQNGKQTVSTNDTKIINK